MTYKETWTALMSSIRQTRLPESVLLKNGRRRLKPKWQRWKEKLTILPVDDAAVISMNQEINDLTAKVTELRRTLGNVISELAPLKQPLT